jgi:microcystin-dependent protein
MLQPWYGTTAPSGWVRCNGRTIGAAGSGATERANADTEDLFTHLWTVDASLTVSTGRGGSAASDWAANKTIALPDCRDRVISALATMGNSDAGLVADTYVTAGTDTSTLGALAGVDDVTLTEANLAAHDHDASFTGDALAGHSHTLTSDDSAHGLNGENNSGNFYTSDGDVKTDEGPESQATSSDSAGTPAGTVDVQDAGSGTAHNNMPPTIYATVLLKL